MPAPLAPRRPKPRHWPDTDGATAGQPWWIKPGDPPGHQQVRTGAESCANPKILKFGHPRMPASSRRVISRTRDLWICMLMAASLDKTVLATGVRYPEVTEKMLDTCPEKFPRRARRAPKLPKRCWTIVSKLSPSCPESRASAQCRPKLAPVWATCCPDWAKSWSKSARMGQSCPNVGNFGPKRPILGPNKATRRQLVGNCSATLGKSGGRLDRRGNFREPTASKCSTTFG